MSYDTLPVTPQYALAEKSNFSTIKTVFENGDAQTRPRWPKARRSWVLQWHAASSDEAEQIVAFLRDHVGPADAFYVTLPDKVPRPYKAPILGYALGGSLGSRTLYARYTWYTTSGETTASYNYDSLALTNGQLLTVQVREIPENVDYAFVYVGTAPDTMYRQNLIAESWGTWTEPTSGYSTSGDSLPTENTLSETALVRLKGKNVSVTKRLSNVYLVTFEVEEVFA